MRLFQLCIYFSLLLGIFLNVGPANAQQGMDQELKGVWNKIKKDNKTEQIPAAPFQAVTTSIKDAYPIANWLDSYSQIVQPRPTSSLTVYPGYYRITVRSYCLHAGAYAPTRGAAYLLSPLKGTQATLITSILKKSEERTDVAQQDVQRLIWGIEAGVKYSQYPADFQTRIAPLLSPQDIASMETVTFLSSKLNSLVGYLPQDIKQIAGYFNDFRRMLTNPSLSYAEIEQYAVKTGLAPLGPGSKDYGVGQWAYARDGFYIREVGHAGYQSTTLEVLRPAPYALIRDAKGRIEQLRSGNITMEISYQDQPGVISVTGAPSVHQWQVANVRLLGPVGHAAPVSLKYLQSRTTLSVGDGTAALERLAGYGSAIGHPLDMHSQGARDFADIASLVAGFSPLTKISDATGADPNLSSVTETAMNAWAYAGCTLLGHCSPLSEAQTTSSITTGSLSPSPSCLELSSFVESPANTSMQRLAQSGNCNAPAGSSASSANLILRLEILNGQLMGLENALLWIDCALPTTEATGAALAGDVVVQALQPSLEPQFAEDAADSALLIDLGKAIGDLVTTGDPVGLFTTAAPQSLLQAYGFKCNSYDLGRAIVSNLQRASESMAAGGNSFTYTGIVPGSISTSQGVVTAESMLKNGAQNRKVKFGLHLVACTNSADCLSQASAPPSRPSSSASTKSSSTKSTQSKTTPSVNSSTTQPPKAVTDEIIIENINKKLLADSGLKSREILITSQNGVVTLAGTVNSQIEREEAERIAKSEKGVQQVQNQLAVSPVVRSNSTSALPAGVTKRNIRSVDFQNFDYASNCFGENAPAEVIHVSKGQANNEDEEFWADKPVYGDLKGDGQEEAVVVLSCHPSGMSPNVVSSEIFIFEMSQGGPKVLAKLPPSYWKNERVAGAKVGNKQLAVDFLEVGDNGSRACPEWIVTTKFRWNGSRFVNAAESRRKNNCSQ
jgi:hypothetical protein